MAISFFHILNVIYGCLRDIHFQESENKDFNLIPPWSSLKITSKSKPVKFHVCSALVQAVNMGENNEYKFC